MMEQGQESSRQRMGSWPIEDFKNWSPENSRKEAHDETGEKGRAQQNTAGNLALIQRQWEVPAVIRLVSWKEKPTALQGLDW